MYISIQYVRRTCFVVAATVGEPPIHEIIAKIRREKNREKRQEKLIKDAHVRFSFGSHETSPVYGQASPHLQYKYSVSEE